MLDLRMLRQRPEEVAELLKRRGFVLDLKLFQTLEEERKRLQSETETNPRRLSNSATSSGRCRSILKSSI
jgi:seryl-tRNA synthetase